MRTIAADLNVVSIQRPPDSTWHLEELPIRKSVDSIS